MARVDPDVGQDLEWKAAEYRYSYNIGTIECVAFPRFQKSSPYESEREARITFPKKNFLLKPFNFDSFQFHANWRTAWQLRNYQNSSRKLFILILLYTRITKSVSKAALSLKS